MASPERFAAPRKKLRRALHHIEDLDRAIAEYLQSTWYKYAFRRDDAGQYQLDFNIVGEPRDIGLIVGDAIHNLRSALDLLAVELVSLNGASTSNVRFPFCVDSSAVDEAIKDAKISRASNRAQAMIRDLRPYKGGNDALRALHDLDIQDKHRAMIPAACMGTTPQIRVVLDENGAPKGIATNQLELEVIPS